MYTLLTIDGNGESQVVASFLVHKEDETSIRKMLQIFKKINPKWSHTAVVMTDKDMTKRNIKSEMLQVSLQICLFHVLRTFGREISVDKMSISSGEKTTILSHIQDITYSRSEVDYISKYESLCDVMCDRIRKYYDTNWHPIRSEWVEGLKSLSMNLGTRTNNRIESFFSHLKKSVILRGSLQDFFVRYMMSQDTLRTERSHRLLNSLTKMPVHAVSHEELPFRKHLTLYAFGLLQSQMSASKKVNVLSPTSVESSSGVRELSDTSCACEYFTSIALPCKHIFGYSQVQWV